MNGLIKEKMEIANRAGVLHAELSGLSRAKQQIEHKAMCKETLNVVIGNHEFFESYRYDKAGRELHDLVIQFIDDQIKQRIDELDELIKILK